MYQEDEMISELEARADKVQAVIAQSSGRVSRAVTRIAEIEQRLPSVIFQAAMGDIDTDEPDNLHSELATLRQRVEDHKHIAEEGRKANIRLQGELTKLRMTRGRRVEYEGIKQQLADDPVKLKDSALIRTGLFLSEALHGDKSNFERFMAEVSTGKAA